MFHKLLIGTGNSSLGCFNGRDSWLQVPVRYFTKKKRVLSLHGSYID